MRGILKVLAVGGRSEGGREERGKVGKVELGKGGRRRGEGGGEVK